MKRILLIQFPDISLRRHQIGDMVRETLVSALTRHGYHVLPSDPYDPDWTVHVHADEHEFIVVVSYHIHPPASWSIFLEDVNHKPLDKDELQDQFNPIIEEAIASLPFVKNVDWYSDFSFLKKI